jgi:hypothetical protein
MILLPLPHWVFPTAGPPFGPYEGAVDEALREVDFASLVQVLRERVEHPVQRAIATPLLEATMAGLIRRVARRQVLPWSTRAENPQNAIEHVSRIAPRASSSIASPPRLGNQRLDEVPLLFGQIHLPHHVGGRSTVGGFVLIGRRSLPPIASPAQRVYEMRSPQFVKELRCPLLAVGWPLVTHVFDQDRFSFDQSPLLL